MQPKHWIQRWKNRQIGFHQDQINPWLIEHWPTLGVPAGAPVFVPLAGKSLDMWWLADRGHPVLGVELSPIAVREFFAEADVEPQRGHHDHFEHCSARQVDLWCGDLFDLSRDDLSTIGAIYDRAALVAMPPSMRPDYAAKLVDILPPVAPLLLITMEYPEQQMRGPPFPVPETEVRSLFESHFKIDLIAEADILDQEPHFRKRGLTELTEKAFVLRRA